MSGNRPVQIKLRVVSDKENTKNCGSDCPWLHTYVINKDNEWGYAICKLFTISLHNIFSEDGIRRCDVCLESEMFGAHALKKHIDDMLKTDEG